MCFDTRHVLAYVTVYVSFKSPRFDVVHPFTFDVCGLLSRELEVAISLFICLETSLMDLL